MKRLSEQEIATPFPSATFYNDFLIVRTILHSLPEHILEALQKELRTFEQRLRCLLPITGDQPGNHLSIKPIADVLMRVEKKDCLLQDFLLCGGYYETTI